MGCGSSTNTAPNRGNSGTQPQPPQPGQTGKPGEPKPAAKNAPQPPPVAASVDPEFDSEIRALGHVFARVLVGSKMCYAAIGAEKNILEMCVVMSTGGQIFHAAFTEADLTAKKEAAKLSWGAVFRTLRSGLRKASAKEPTASDPLTLSLSVDKGPTLSFPLKSANQDAAILHRMILTPLTQLYVKAKTGDDSRFVKVEQETTSKKASLAENSQKVATLQVEVEPMSKTCKRDREEVLAARERVFDLRKRVRKLKIAKNKERDPLYPEAPTMYLLHTSYSKEHFPKPSPCNYNAMYLVREKYGGELLTRPPAADDLAHDRIVKLLGKIDDWDFDVFSLQQETKGGALTMTCYALLYKYGLVSHFNIDEKVLVSFLQALESGYHPNPYHNAVHAADVLQITHYIIEPGGLKQTINMTQCDCLAALLSAAIHDYDHPGFNNNFHIRTNAYLAILYNDRSVLENHHLAQVFDLVKNPRYNIFASLTPDQYKDVRDTMLEMVLSTDMGLHAKIYQTFRRRLGGDSQWTTKDDQRLALCIAIKMADISNCCRPAHLYSEWGRNIASEFYNQGDAESRLNLTISPFMDRHKDKTDFPKGQISFINYIVLPLFEAAAQLLPKMMFAVDEAKRNKQELNKR